MLEHGARCNSQDARRSKQKVGVNVGQDRIKKIARLRAERDVIDCEINAYKNKITEIRAGALSDEQRLFAIERLAELHAKRLELSDKLFDLRQGDIHYEI